MDWPVSQKFNNQPIDTTSKQFPNLKPFEGVALDLARLEGRPGTEDWY